jgi:hypothetical protein
MSGLAGDAKTDADFSPGVAGAAQALDRLSYNSVDLLGQTEHEGQGLDVAVPHAAGVGAQDAPDECSIWPWLFTRLVRGDPPARR